MSNLFYMYVLFHRREKTTKEVESEASDAPKLDLGFKEGQTIKINLAGVRCNFC